MKSLIGDLHTHTLASGHAYGTIREMAQAASEEGLSLLGITEHSPGIPGTCHPIYFVNLHVIPRNLYGVDLLFGSEINVGNDGTRDLEERYMEHLDYAIIGIHTVCYTDEGRIKNTDNIIRCMQHEKVRIVSHPDDDHTPLDYERLVLGAKEHHVALEVNNSSFLKPHVRLNCVENYKTMLKFCEQYRVPVMVDTDAHDPDSVGKASLAMQFLADEGFDEELILNNDLRKVRQFLLEPK